MKHLIKVNISVFQCDSCLLQHGLLGFLQAAHFSNERILWRDLQSSPSWGKSQLSARPTACPWTSCGGADAPVEAGGCRAERSRWPWLPDAACPPDCRPSGCLSWGGPWQSGSLRSSRGRSGSRGQKRVKHRDRTYTIFFGRQLAYTIFETCLVYFKILD